ncbi:Hypothetical_protein [Hexamita inflata]|uniref:Hypothetical_protein n=1 Tax=Hexamita inflata TaxID=28002 RepID=A0AA86RHU3_9EUKA|nr:Hypothetical protein HINF_LOCUS66334 [Hexamita inflata]
MRGNFSNAKRYEIKVKAKKTRARKQNSRIRQAEAAQVQERYNIDEVSVLSEDDEINTYQEKPVQTKQINGLDDVVKQTLLKYGPESLYEQTLQLVHQKSPLLFKYSLAVLQTKMHFTTQPIIIVSESELLNVNLPRIVLFRDYVKSKEDVLRGCNYQFDESKYNYQSESYIKAFVKFRHIQLINASPEIFLKYFHDYNNVLIDYSVFNTKYAFCFDFVVQNELKSLQVLTKVQKFDLQQVPKQYEVISDSKFFNQHNCNSFKYFFKPDQQIIVNQLQNTFKLFAYCIQHGVPLHFYYPASKFNTDLRYCLRNLDLDHLKLFSSYHFKQTDQQTNNQQPNSQQQNNQQNEQYTQQNEQTQNNQNTNENKQSEKKFKKQKDQQTDNQQPNSQIQNNQQNELNSQQNNQNNQNTNESENKFKKLIPSKVQVLPDNKNYFSSVTVSSDLIPELQQKNVTYFTPKNTKFIFNVLEKGDVLKELKVYCQGLVKQYEFVFCGINVGEIQSEIKQEIIECVSVEEILNVCERENIMIWDAINAI